MKIFFVCLFQLLCIANSFSQTTDTTKWVTYLNSDSTFSIIYPSFFEINRWNEKDIACKQLVSLNYMYYEPIDESPNTDSLENPSGMTILLCNKNFSQIANEFGFYEKNGYWYGDSIYIPADKDYYDYDFETYAGFAIHFDDWFGIKAIYQTSIFKKGGGAWTAAGESYKFILYRKIASDKSLLVNGYGFDFPQADKVLIKICRSIILNNK